jgi:hypothetical protein
MTRVIIIFLSFITLTAFGQVDNYRIFQEDDYPANKYSIKADTFYFLDFKIELIQARLNDYRDYQANESFCRIWLTVKNDTTTIDRLFYNDCEAVGGCSGIYVSPDQTSKDYFILSKFGDYDGKIILVDSSGKINKYFGGHYYLSDDHNYLFSPYNSDIPGLTIFDLSKNQVLFTSDSIEDYLADFYFYDNKFFATLSESLEKPGRTDIVTYDIRTNRLIKSTVDDAYIQKSRKLDGYNMITYAPCSCGQIK